MADEPGHQALCDREQAYVLKAIREDHRSDAAHGGWREFAQDRAGGRSKRARRPGNRSLSEERDVGSLKLQGVRKSFGDFEALKGVDLDISDGEFVVFVGPSGCGKSTLLRVIAGLEEHTARPCADRRSRGRRGAAGQARHRHGVPDLRALSASDRARQHGAGPEAGRQAARRDRRARERGGAHAGAGAAAGSAAVRAVRRPAPARRDRPRRGAQAAAVPVRRAAVQPRCRPAREHAAGDRAPAPAAEGHHHLCDPRPGRGDDPGRPHRGAEPGRRSSRSDRRSSSIAGRPTCSSPASSARPR